MKKITTVILLIINAISCLGNDGVYLSNGGVIYPVKETKISLEKEILSFTVRDNVAFVNIQFEFNNPESKERKLLIGFQAPTPEGDVSDSICNTNLISNFTIVKDGVILPYTVKAAKCEDCRLEDFKEPENIHFSQFDPGVFVFLFEVIFKPGINMIQHSYSFPASHGVAFDETYGYILTTGSKWAGGKIKDLIVKIDMGENKYFFVNDIFGEKAIWSIIGTGKVTNETFGYIEGDSNRMIRILSGELLIEINNFKPTKNIHFGILDKKSFVSGNMDYTKIQSGEVVPLGNMTLQSDYSKKELRLMRNTIYAQYGYDFNSPDLKEYFSQFAWYMPNPNLKMEDIKLTKEEQEFIFKVKEREE